MLGDCLNESRLAGVVLKDPPQLGNTVLQGVVGHERVRPHRPHQFFFAEGFIRVPGQAHQHLHHLRLQPSSRAVAGDGVQAGLNQPRPYSEVSTHDSTHAG